MKNRSNKLNKSASEGVRERGKEREREKDRRTNGFYFMLEHDSSDGHRPFFKGYERQVILLYISVYNTPAG